MSSELILVNSGKKKSWGAESSRSERGTPRSEAMTAAIVGVTLATVVAALGSNTGADAA